MDVIPAHENHTPNPASQQPIPLFCPSLCPAAWNWHVVAGAPGHEMTEEWVLQALSLEAEMPDRAWLAHRALSHGESLRYNVASES